jgi:putative endonuclease
MPGFVYVLGNKPNGVLYIGVTNSLERRISEHKQKLVPGFTSAHNVRMLYWFEYFENIALAIRKEKQMKAWRRQWKINAIVSMNPEWHDLSQDWFDWNHGPQPSLG